MNNQFSTNLVKRLRQSWSVYSFAFGLADFDLCCVSSLRKVELVERDERMMKFCAKKQYGL
ncbi:MAG: hypothetical protein NZ805_01785 [Armatimonadetes bacterium]|nr:hypothetical protein [Armatimonadota bacterium]